MLTVKTSSSPSSPSFWSAVEEVVEPTEQRKGITEWCIGDGDTGAHPPSQKTETENKGSDGSLQ